MQLSAFWFVKQIQQKYQENNFDLVLCSTFVDVAVLKALLVSESWWESRTPFLIYFHENQFSYPGQIDDPQIFHFSSLNFNSAMAADSLAFNSAYNYNSFIDGIKKYLKKATDVELLDSIDSIENKSIILYPGLDFTTIDQAKPSDSTSNDPPVILWNHRWEHDKGPELFFSSLYSLQKKQIPFQLIVLGQSFKRQPACFQEAKEKLKEQILHFGYIHSKEEYSDLLHRGDIVVSTAYHEFFGLAVIEAVRAGCTPLLPDRLSYVELFDNCYRYDSHQLTKRLSQLLKTRKFIDTPTSIKLTDRFNWSNLQSSYSQWFSSVEK